MFIKSMTLVHLVAFKCAAISSLTLTCSDIIQVILGTNGSGKSNLLRQLNPMPAVSTDFVAGLGYKELTIDHNGVIYRLISDFRKKGPAHEFWAGETNLNEGGTTDVQKDLVQQYFDWSSDVEALCYNSMMFTDMGASQREALFMRLNPDQIEFVLDRAKKTKSLIKSTKIILARLLERKVQLESRLLPEEALQALQKEQGDLTDEYNRLANVIYFGSMKTKNAMMITPTSQRDMVEHIRDLDRMLKDAIRVSRSEWDINRKDPQESIAAFETQKAVLAYRLETLKGQSGTLAQTLRVEREKLIDYDPELSEQAIMAEVVSETERLAEIAKTAVETPLPNAVLDNQEAILTDIRNLLQDFATFPTPIYSRKRLDLKNRHLSHWRHVLRDLHNQLDGLDRRLAASRKTLSLKQVDIPDQPCAKSRCPLWVSFTTNQEQITDSIARDEALYRSVARTAERVGGWVEGQQAQIADYTGVREALGSLGDFSNRNPELAHFFKPSNTLHRLGTNPMGIYYQIEALFKQSTLQREVPQIKERLLRHELALEKLRAVSEQTHQTTLKQIELHDKQLAEYQKQMGETEKEIREIDRLIQKAQSYAMLQQLVARREEEWSDLIAHETGIYDLKKTNRILKDLGERQSEIQIRLGEISQILREQNGLVDRYQHEVVDQIAENDNVLTQLEWLKEGLDEVPRVRTIKFLNRLIRESCGYIRKVFTYDFKLDTLPVDKPVNYRFPYKANSAPGPDIIRCSTAQKEITNLALTLACRKVKGMDDYPLFLDEVGKTFDFAHQQKLLDLLLYIVDEKRASQIFIVNHHAVIHDGLTNTETLVLHEANIMKTESYNTHAQIERF